MGTHSNQYFFYFFKKRSGIEKRSIHPSPGDKRSHYPQEKERGIKISIDFF